MAEVIEPIIKVDVGDSTQTVKGLKEEIKQLRDRILNLQEGTDDYSEAVSRLQDDQRKLNEVMALTKKEAVALDGSYDALVHQMSQLKKEWRATADEAERNSIGAQIDEINQQLKEMDASVGNFQRNVGNYVSHWEGMPEVTKDFGTAMREMNEQIEPTKQKFESVGKIASGLASGFAAVKGAAALLGVENENLEETFVKLQAAMALAQGIGGMAGLVEGVGKAKVAFAGLNSSIKTINTTLGKAGWVGIILTVIATIALVTDAIKKKRKEVDNLDESLKKLDKRNENILASDKERAKQLERDIKLMAANGATEKEILEKRLEYNQIYVDASKKNYDEAQKQYLGLRDSLSMGIEGVTQEDVDKAKEIYDAANATYKEYSEKRKDILNDMVIVGINANKKIEDDLKESLKRRDELVRGVIDSASDFEIEDAEIAVDTKINLDDKNGEAEKRASLQIGFAERVANRQIALNNMVEQSEEVRAAKEFEIRQNLEQKKLDLLKQAKAEADKNGDTVGAWNLAQQIADQEIAIEKAKYDELDRLRQEDLAKREENKQQIMAITNAAMNATASLLGSIADMYESDEESAKKNAAKIKGLRIAEATINTINGAVGAFSQAAATIPPPAGLIIGGVQAAAVTAAGLANIMKIRQTKMDGSSSSTGFAMPNAGSYSSELPATYTRELTGMSEIDTYNQDTRFYVVESDITDAVERNRGRVEEASF